ncbi:putative glutathione-specific gamma-glutamylcyclotransferase 2 [Styela clava]|uniref:putative glutathione-specific gamma-glutamylcyclotransferase 2 n=1 Tax=Styela clava TaxID=7725 RepID=UPI0019393999|nr:putative glutathione-specific gamma-glutamylcyclotransferase 2 [Styela clava]
MCNGSSSHIWIFGYGSLLWKADFPFVQKVIGYIEGFERKFWQSSEDHRGVPDNPGRVATLVEKVGGVVWGAAYKLPCDKSDEVLRHLDHREKGGYKTMKTTFFPRDKTIPSFELLIYIGTPDNPNFIGPETLHEISDVIVNAVGPSGPNVEYLLNLAEFVKTYIPEDKDSHLFGLEQLVRERISTRGEYVKA